jgi:ABC-2 type transport system ATP-binding protein
LINEPEIVFFDEPMSGLDPIGRREIRELIIELRQKGTTVFMSTHILSDVEALCDEVAILRRGKLTATGHLDELLSRQGEQQVYEVSLTNLSANQLSGGYSVRTAASGVIVEVEDESEVEKVLFEARNAGGKLISVQPVRQSLEELFVEPSTESTGELSGGQEFKQG